MSDTMASRAILMFWKDPRMWILLHAEQEICQLAEIQPVSRRISQGK